jgi:hypothetical protein
MRSTVQSLPFSKVPYFRNDFFPLASLLFNGFITIIRCVSKAGPTSGKAFPGEGPK